MASNSGEENSKDIPHVGDVLHAAAYGDIPTTSLTTAASIEGGDTLLCPIDVDLDDSDTPAADVDFWDYFNNPPASPPRTASGRSRGRWTFASNEGTTIGITVDPN